MAATAVKSEDDMSVLKLQLYHACEDKFHGDYERPLTQEDLMSLDVIPNKDIKKMLEIIQVLTKERLFAPVNLHSGLAWRLRPEAEAAKYKLLSTQEQVLVYEIIDAAGADGAWQQDIKRRLNIQDNALRKALKELDTKRLVVQFTSVDNITKKMWIKSNIQPSARTTGGPFYTDSVLDEDFIEALMEVIVDMAKEQGAYRSTRERRPGSISPIMPKKGIVRGGPPPKIPPTDSAAEGNSKKRSADAMAAGEDGHHHPQHHTKSRRGGGTTRLLPLSAGYKDYITTREVTEKLEKVNVAKGQPLRDEHVQELVDVLVWDGRLEEVALRDNVTGYRLTRISRLNPASRIPLDAEDYWEKRENGLTTAPCGRCPVFDICEEGGPVWAGGCEYLDKWLA